MVTRSRVRELESGMTVLESLVFPLLAGALCGAQAVRNLRETQGAIALRLMSAFEILLFFELLKARREVDCGKVLAAEGLRLKGGR